MIVFVVYLVNVICAGVFVIRVYAPSSSKNQDDGDDHRHNNQWGKGIHVVKVGNKCKHDGPGLHIMFAEI